MAYVFLALGVLLVAGALGSVAAGDGGWSAARLVVAILYTAYAVWFLLRARRRDRAAGSPPP